MKNSANHTSAINNGKNFKHTPGPWGIEVTHVSEGAYTISRGTNSHGDGPAGYVCKVYTENEADARLIAAAPELLALARGSRALVLEKLNSGYDTEYWEQILSECDAAIAKATGGAA